MPKNKPTTFRMPLDEVDRYTTMAKAMNLSMTDFILEALRDKYDRQSQLDRFFADGTLDEVWHGHA